VSNKTNDLASAATSDELPIGWTTCRLGEALTLVNGRAYSQHEMLSEGTPILRIQNLNKGKNWFYSNLNLPPDKYCNKGDLLYAWSATFGPYWWHGPKAIFHYHIWNVYPSELMSREFAFYELMRITDAIKRAAHGVAMPHITKGGMEAWEIMVPPPAEQKRIADKLAAVQGRVDACRARLDRVPELLKRFRQSVLAAATSGQLTEDWREKNQGGEWQKKKLTELGELGRGKSKHRPRNDSRLYGGPYPFIQTGDVANSGERITMHSQTYSEFGLAQSKLWPAGTVCITIAANIADTSILDYDACFPDSVVGFVANPKECLPEFIKWTVDVIKDDLEAFAPATAQKNINLGVLYEVELSIPPLPEQAEIVRRVEALFALADRIEARLTAARAQVERLTPATLAKAFRGDLVPQDPNDEPASKLLERVRTIPAPKALRKG